MLAPALSTIALGLVMLFGIAVVSQLFPLRLLIPAWQLRVAGVLIERGPLALLGLALLQLAAHLDPANAGLQARWQKLGRLGVVAVLGFLLLIPLQLVAAIGSIQGMTSTQRGQQQRVERNLTQLRQQIRESSNFPELQRRIRDIQAPDLVVQADALQQPFPQLQRSLLASVDQSEQLLRRRLGGGTAGQTWEVMERSARGVVSALVLGLCFAAATPLWNDSELSLLMTWQWQWRQRRNRRRRHNAALSDEDYLRQLSEE
ncbi:MAG: hypothetical protein VKO65_02525 [Cyanobacteriota bacterium]|nr:hypothetical protein [Cyanobacteriota bacterium]